MYEDIIAAVMQDIQADAATARAKALRGQQPPMPPPPGAAPQQPMPGPPPGAAPQQPMPGPPGAPTGPQNGPALPKTLGQGQKPPVGPPGPTPGPVPQAPPAQPPDAGPDLVGEEQRLRTQQQEALAQQQRSYAMPDRTASVEAFQRQQGQGANHLMLALAAQHAGPDFQPLQVHFLKRAAEASAPMKMAGGTMTETGFVEDPGYAQELDAKRADARVKQLDTALAGNLTAQERRRLEAEKMQHQTELRRMMGGIALQVAGMSAGRGAEAAADRRQSSDFRTEDSMSKQFDSQVKDYVTELDATRKLTSLAPGRRPNAIEQQSMIILLNKFLDPTSVVREGEFNRVAQAQGLVQRAQNYADQILRGEPMSDELVRSVRDMAGLYEKAAVSRIQQTGDLYTDKAGRRGLNPENVVVNPYYKQRGAQQPQAGGAAVPTAVNPQTGETLRLINGQWVK